MRFEVRIVETREVCGVYIIEADSAAEALDAVCIGDTESESFDDAHAMIVKRDVLDAPKKLEDV